MRRSMSSALPSANAAAAVPLRMKCCCSMCVRARLTVRIWQQPRVKLGGRYRLGEGAIEVTAIRGITRHEITPALAERSGFDSVEALLEVAQHGSGRHVFVVEFVYHA